MAWKLALEMHGRSRPGLLESFSSERLAADRHVVEVSDRLDAIARGAVESARTGVRAAPPTPAQVASLVQSRSMLDVSYAGSPLVGEYVASGEQPPPPQRPGERYRNRTRLTDTRHHLLLFGDASDGEGVARLHRRWDGLVDIIHAAGDPRQTGLHSRGAVLVRPDGHIGFRAIPADAAGMEALDRHLDSYLVPGLTVAALGSARRASPGLYSPLSRL